MFVGQDDASKSVSSFSFEEMPTNRYVESSFWNFDALFQPQQHPARDAHDTFFLQGLVRWSIFLSSLPVNHFVLPFSSCGESSACPSSLHCSDEGDARTRWTWFDWVRSPRSPLCSILPSFLIFPCLLCLAAIFFIFFQLSLQLEDRRCSQESSSNSYNCYFFSHALPACADEAFHSQAIFFDWSRLPQWGRRCHASCRVPSSWGRIMNPQTDRPKWVSYFECSSIFFPCSGLCCGQESDSGRFDWGHFHILPKARYEFVSRFTPHIETDSFLVWSWFRIDSTEVQACIQSIYWAVHGDFCTIKWARQMAWNRQLGHFPAWNVDSDGTSWRRSCHCMGSFSWASDHDPLSLLQHSRSLWLQSGHQHGSKCRAHDSGIANRLSDIKWGQSQLIVGPWLPFFFLLVKALTVIVGDVCLIFVQCSIHIRL